MLPTEEQRRGLCEMLHRALLEIRILGWRGNGSQAGDLADAFHNLPIHMISQDFDQDLFRHLLEVYQNKYPRPKSSEVNYFDYVAFLDNIING